LALKHQKSNQSNQWPNEKRQKDKQWSTKHYTENYLSNTNPTKNRGITRVLRKSRQFIFLI
jgi:hypothetical protein